MPIFDTHCHLNHELFEGDLTDVIDRAQDGDVRRLLVVGYDTASSRRAVEIATLGNNLLAAVGIHPEAATEWSEAVRELLTSLHFTNQATVKAWGEIGLDYHWKTVDPQLQKNVLIEQLRVASSLSLPVVIHCREAYDDTLDILEAYGAGSGALHCFTGSIQQAQRGLALGYHIGVGGVITFKNSHSVREMIKTVPLSRLLLETDAPYLAPQAWRGKRNEPAYLTSVVEQLAMLFQTTPDVIADATWKNATVLFS